MENTSNKSIQVSSLICEANDNFIQKATEKHSNTQDGKCMKRKSYLTKTQNKRIGWKRKTSAGLLKGSKTSPVA